MASGVGDESHIEGAPPGDGYQGSSGNPLASGFKTLDRPAEALHRVVHVAWRII